MSDHHPDGEGGDGNIDEEDQSPRHRLDEETSQQRPNRSEHATETRPGSDGPPSLVGTKARLDDRQTARGEEGTANALRGPRRE